MKFGFNDYLRMWKKRGIRLPFSYFFQAHLFDLVHRKDTHMWLPKEKYIDSPKNFESGVLYMSSWTNTIKLSTNKAVNLLSLNPKNTAFIDIGCGKGKVLCMWNKMFPKAKHIIGIDYSPQLIEICEKNLHQTSKLKVELICADVTEIELEFNCEVFLFYLFNPFDSKILNKFLKKISNKKAVIIYNNPIHKTTIVDNGFNEHFDKESWHPNASFAIFSNINLT
ncbi:class I SAM-dependent methyltransferase [Candidatus Pseudothioglobus sp. Uisw_086]|uniref:class I SAM-dependent methyltransferase n=1 Tax=Candidatus Pseudothioglobus sp. Uisw_086 TaxID=3230998 RepID=UPI003A89E572